MSFGPLRLFEKWRPDLTLIYTEIEYQIVIILSENLWYLLLLSMSGIVSGDSATYLNPRHNFWSFSKKRGKTYRDALSYSLDAHHDGARFGDAQHFGVDLLNSALQFHPMFVLAFNPSRWLRILMRKSISGLPSVVLFSLKVSFKDSSALEAPNWRVLAVVTEELGRWADWLASSLLSAEHSRRLDCIKSLKS